MQKTVTLRCPSCGATHDFAVGAGPQLAEWQGVAERLPDKRETEKARDILKKAIEKRTKAAGKELLRNGAEVLGNVCYSVCGEESVLLTEESVPESNERIFGEKVRESIASSKEKWTAAAEREGILAFDAIYICPKSRKPKQGLHMSVRLKNDKGTETVYQYKNKCEECGSHMTLADDGNLGFMHEDMKTVARCKCGAQLVIDKVSFKQPVKEQEESMQ
ncbi:MAG: hypothetical protein HFE46_08615 [Clostridia bacterium]|nr:hypothetical protein [Clostridia bacterium]